MAHSPFFTPDGKLIEIVHLGVLDFGYFQLDIKYNGLIFVSDVVVDNANSASSSEVSSSPESIISC